MPVDQLLTVVAASAAAFVLALLSAVAGFGDYRLLKVATEGFLTAATVEPLYRMTLWYDRHRLAEIDADIAGTPYRPDDQRWAVTKATFAAGLADPEVARAHLSLVSLLNTPDEVLAEPGMLGRIVALGMHASRNPPPGPDRASLLATLDA